MIRYSSFRQIKFGGKWSLEDFGVLIGQESDTNTRIEYAKPRVLRETVPFRDGSYDYSRMSGKLVYDDRTLRYTFIISGHTRTDVEEKVRQLDNWLGDSCDTELYDTDFQLWKFTGVSYLGMGDLTYYSSNENRAQVTAEFIAAPYMRSLSGKLIDCLDFTPDAAATRYLFSIFRPSQATPVYYFLSRMAGYGSGGIPSGYVSYDEVSHSGSVIAATPRVTFPVSNSNPMYHIMPKQMSGTAVSVSDCSGGSVVKETDTYIYFMQNRGEALSIGIGGYDARSLADESVRSQVTTQIRYAGWLYPDERQYFRADSIPGTGNMRIISEADVILTIDPPSGSTSQPADISDFRLSLYDLLTLTGAKDQLCKLQYNTVRLRR